MRRSGMISFCETVGTCDICDGKIIEDDSFKLVDDVLYCPECYEDAVAAGKVIEDDD